MNCGFCGEWIDWDEDYWQHDSGECRHEGCLDEDEADEVDGWVLEYATEEED